MFWIQIKKLMAGITMIKIMKSKYNHCQKVVKIGKERNNILLNHFAYRTCSSTNCARLLPALVYKPRDLLHKIHFLTALKTLDMRY